MSQINVPFAEDQNLDQPNVLGYGDMHLGQIGGEQLLKDFATGLAPRDLFGHHGSHAAKLGASVLTGNTSNQNITD